MSLHPHLSVHHSPQREFRVASAESLTSSAQLLLHEVRCALLHLSGLGEATVIDLRNLSSSPGLTRRVAGRN